MLPEADAGERPVVAELQPSALGAEGQQCARIADAAQLTRGALAIATTCTPGAGGHQTTLGRA